MDALAHCPINIWHLGGLEMKLVITAEQAAKLAAREGDLDPTTGKPDYVPGFVPSAADRHYERKVAALHAKLETYEEILRVVCHHLELPQSESGPADDLRLYDRALEAADEYAREADADLAVNRDARFKAEAEVERLRAGIKRLSDEEELLAETTDGEEFTLVSIAAKLAQAEAENAHLKEGRQTLLDAIQPLLGCADFARESDLSRHELVIVTAGDAYDAASAVARIEIKRTATGGDHE